MKRNIISFVLGAFLFSGIAVYATYKLMASEVSYTPDKESFKVSNVKDALDELYSVAATCPKPSNEGYGVKRKLNAISSTWERTGSSLGLVANAQVGTNSVQNDFDNIYPWSDIISYNYNTDTKQVVAYYGDSNFSFSPSGNIEVLTKIPEFYYKRYQDNEYEYIYISRNQKEGYLKSEEFSIGRYTMSGNSTRVHSKSGAVPFTNHTITDFRGYARNVGEEFSQLDYHYFIIQLLYLVEYADYNSQYILGPGYANSSHTGPIQSGGCDKLGMHSGSSDGTNNSSIIYRGIEDIFGNVWQFVDGINISNYQTYICYDKNQYESDKYDGCYERIGYVNSNSNNAWTSKLGYDKNHPLVSFPIETSGTDSTRVTDKYWGKAGNTIFLAGGTWNSELMDGFWCTRGDNASTFSGPTVSARIIKTS